MGESQPTIERDPPLLASSTSSNAEVRSSAFDHIAKSDVLVADKSGEAHTARRVFAFLCRIVAFDLLRHAIRLHASSNNELLVFAGWRPAAAIAMTVDVAVIRVVVA
jgi:hypothetical protein